MMDNYDKKLVSRPGKRLKSSDIGINAFIPTRREVIDTFKFEELVLQNVSLDGLEEPEVPIIEAHSSLNIGNDINQKSLTNNELLGENKNNNCNKISIASAVHLKTFLLLACSYLEEIDSRNNSLNVC
jgi:hypothetical protein